MPWTTMPVAANAAILKAQFDEVRAAIVERCVAVRWSPGGLAVATGDEAQARALIVNYRSYIDNILPPTTAWFVDPDNGFANWTKAALLTAALGPGRTDWLAAQTPAWMFVDEINELRLVLNALQWVAYIPDGDWVDADGQTKGHLPPTEGSDIDWDDAWDVAKTVYGGQAWGDALSGNLAFASLAFEPSQVPGHTYQKRIYSQRQNGLRFTPPSAGAAQESRMFLPGFSRLAGGEPWLDGLIFEQEGYAGVGIAFLTAAAEQAVAVTPVTPGATAHYSLRFDPEEPADLDAWECADADGAGFGIEGAVTDSRLLVKFGFNYHS